MKTKGKPTPKVPVKIHNNHGMWTPKVTKSQILVCSSCSIKYIKTRPQQITCVKCALVPLTKQVFRLNKDK
jgi:hypothetical protein